MTKEQALQRLRKDKVLTADWPEAFAEGTPLAVMRINQDNSGVTIKTHDGDGHMRPYATLTWAELDEKSPEFWAEWE